MRKNQLGNWFIFSLALINLLLWLAFMPPDDGRPHFSNQVAAEILSTTALILMAVGIGVTPFLSWLRAFDNQDGPQIDFFYSVRSPEEALFLDEIKAAQARRPGFRAHFSYSTRDGHLSVEKIVVASGPLPGKEIFLCGPPVMVTAFKRQFIARGVKPALIHYEEFSFR